MSISYLKRTSYQVLFNQMYLGLKAQGFKRSLKEASRHTCAYRGANGLKCIVGQCISDNTAKDWDDRGGLSAIYTIISGGGISVDQTSKKVQWLEAAQRLHDSSETPTEMVRRLKDFAVEYKLTVPPGDET